VTRDEAHRRFAQAPVARLATADGHGRPHAVPVVFVLADDIVYTAVDGKPKRTTALRRLENIAANPRAAVLVDHYGDDWTSLWWVRADGTGRILDAAHSEGRDAIERLTAKYRQYREQPPGGPVLAIDVDRWSSWAASPRV
jgi:PPOX class probable F420-dependent enzyme